MSYTKGPWHYQKVTNRKFDVVADDGEQICRAHLYEIKECKPFNVADRQTAEANSRLIAAAPELLDALENLAGQVKRHADFGGHAGGWLAFDEAMQAISKATGK